MCVFARAHRLLSSPLIQSHQLQGGSAFDAYSWIQKHGIADETCMPYEGVDHSAWGEVADEDRECRKCDRFGTCCGSLLVLFFRRGLGLALSSCNDVAESARGRGGCCRTPTAEPDSLNSCSAWLGIRGFPRDSCWEG